VSGSSPTAVYRRKHPTSRAYFVRSVAPARDMQDAADILRAGPWDPREWAVIEFGSRREPSSIGEVRTLSWRSGEVHLTTDNAQQGFLFVSEACYPGWIALVDGQEFPVRVTNVAFQGIWIPSGRHDVILKYTPRIFIAGLTLSAFGCVAALSTLWIARKSDPSRSAFSQRSRSNP
jgi:hypothetical protein